MRRLLLKRRWQVVFCCAACAVVWAAWLLLYALPRMGAVRSIRANLKQAELTYGRLAQDASSLPARQEALANAESEIESTLGGLPSEEQIPEVTRSLAELAADCNLDVVTADLGLETIFGAEPPIEMQGLSKLPLRLVVRGGYGEIGRFLEEMADLGSYIECRSVVLDRWSSKPGSIRATVSVNLYSLAYGAGQSGRKNKLAWADRAADGPGPEEAGD